LFDFSDLERPKIGVFVDSNLAIWRSIRKSDKYQQIHHRFVMEILEVVVEV